MTGAEVVLAFYLLTAPVSCCPEAPPETARWPAVQSAVRKLAVEWEILDERETGYILAKPEEFGIDVNLLRKRYQELKGVPRIAEAQRLPDRDTCCEMIKFNRSYRKSLDNRHLLETDRAHDIQTAIRETDRLYAVWDSVRDARCDMYYITVRRHALRKLRDLVGEESYALGELPPVVPTWRFADTK